MHHQDTQPRETITEFRLGECWLNSGVLEQSDTRRGFGWGGIPALILTHLQHSGGEFPATVLPRNGNRSLLRQAVLLEVVQVLSGDDYLHFSSINFLS